MEAHHDAAVDRYALADMTGVKGFNKDDVSVAMEHPMYAATWTTSYSNETGRLFIDYWKSHGIDAGCVCPGAVSNGRVRRLWGWWRHGEDGA